MSLTILAAFAAAFVAGTFFEYVIHRWFAHGPLAVRSTGQLARHAGVHHRVFTDRRGMTAPRGTARRTHVHVSLGALVMLILLLAAGAACAGLLIAGDLEGAPMMAAAIASGLFATLILYDFIHWMHHAELPRFIANMPIYKQLRFWHFAHHRAPYTRFSTLLPLWDYLLFTHRAGSLIEDEAPVEKVDTSRGKRRTASSREEVESRMLGMMAQACSDAETNLDAQEQPAKRRGFFGGGSDESPADKQDPAPRSRGVTGNARAVDAAAKADESAPPTARARGKGKRKGAKTTADWLASLEVDAGLEIKVTAVKEEEP